MFFVKIDTSVTGYPGRVFKSTMRRLYDMLEGVGATGQYTVEQGSEKAVDLGMKLIPSTRTQTLVGTPNTLVLDVGHIKFISNGAGADNFVTLPSGTHLGQRITLELLTRTHASDTIALTIANVEEQLSVGGTPGGATAYKLGTAGMKVLLEWAGTKWNLLYGTGTLAS